MLTHGLKIPHTNFDGSSSSNVVTVKKNVNIPIFLFARVKITRFLSEKSQRYLKSW